MGHICVGGMDGMGLYCDTYLSYLSGKKKLWFFFLFLNSEVVVVVVVHKIR